MRIKCIKPRPDAPQWSDACAIIRWPPIGWTKHVSADHRMAVGLDLWPWYYTSCLEIIAGCKEGYTHEMSGIVSAQKNIMWFSSYWAYRCQSVKVKKSFLRPGCYLTRCSTSVGPWVCAVYSTQNTSFYSKFSKLCTLTTSVNISTLTRHKFMYQSQWSPLSRKNVFTKYILKLNSDKTPTNPDKTFFILISKKQRNFKTSRRLL